MAERVHPTDHSLHPEPASNNSLHFADSLPPPPKNPPPGTYVIQIPKDQVYRLPPPENTARFNLYTCQNHRPYPCRRFLCSILLFASLLLLLSGIVSALFFLILQPISPRYSILAVSINNGIRPNTTSISPQFNVTVRAENPNKKIGLHYEKNSSVAVYFSDVMLCEGALPLLYQPSSNVTVMAVKLKGSGIRLSSSAGKALQDWEKRGKVRLKVDLRAPMKVKVYLVKITWTIRAKVSCKILVMKVTGKTEVMEEKCDHSVKLW